MKKNLQKLAVVTFLLLTFFYGFSQTPVAYWKLDETSGTTTKEEIGDLTSAIVGSISNPFVAAAKGNGIDMTKLDAVTGSVAVSSYAPLEFTTGSFSISAVVKLNKSITTEQDIVAKGFRAAATDGHWYALYISNAGQYTFAVDDNITKTDMKYAIPSTFDGWVHLVAVRNTGSTMLELYANGVQVLTKADATTQSIASPNYPLLIGNTNETNSRFGGIIDEVKIFNVALTQTEITSMFSSYGINADGTLNQTRIENIASRNIEIYPNPASEKIMLTNANGKAWASIYDITGKLVKKVQLAASDKEINITSLYKGLYYITVLDSKNKVVKKGSFIKN